MSQKQLEEPPDDKLLRIEEVAEKLNVTTRTVHKWAAMGRFPKVKLAPGTTRFRLSDINRMINESVN